MRLFPREMLLLKVAAPWGRVVERVRGRARAWPAGLQMRRFGEIVTSGGPRRFQVREWPGYFAPVMRLTVLRESEPVLVRVEIGVSAMWVSATGGIAAPLAAVPPRLPETGDAACCSTALRSARTISSVLG